MLHFWMYSNDLVNGLSVINYAVNSLKLATDANNHSQNFYKSGAASSGLLKLDARLDQKQKDQIKSSWLAAFNDPNSAGVAILPNNIEYQPITINPKDAMLLETRQFDVIEIARFFNISPIKLFDYSKNSYSTLEQTQLSFLEDTVNPYLIMLEQELNRKIFNIAQQNQNEIQFDRTAMLSTDKAALSEYFKNMLVNGIMSINEVRKCLNLNDVDNGDNLFMQLNMSTVDNLINQTPAPAAEPLQQKTKITSKK